MTRLDPHVCGRCAAQGRTCCELSGGDAEFCFPLSEMERVAIVNAGFSPHAMVQAPNTPAFVEQLRVILPDRNVTDAFPETGSHWRLATTEMGQCVFLGESGCVLERGLRPFYCRLFPFWLYQEQLTWFTAEECLAAAECASSAAMLRAMDLSMDEIRELFRAMCAALDLHTR